MEFILSVLIIFWLIGIIAKFLFRRWIRKKQQQFENTFNYQKQEHQNFNRQDGDVTIKGAPTQYAKRINDNVGEYVDFEEIKEKD